MEQLFEPLMGAGFMGIGAGLLAYAYGDKIWGRRDKKKKRNKKAPSGFYNTSEAGPTNKQVRLRRAIFSGICIGLMFFFYFANR